MIKRNKSLVLGLIMAIVCSSLSLHLLLLHKEKQFNITIPDEYFIDRNEDEGVLDGFLANVKVPGIVEGNSFMVETKRYFQEENLAFSKVEVKIQSSNAKDLEIAIGFKSSSERLMLADNPLKEVIVWSSKNLFIMESKNLDTSFAKTCGCNNKLIHIEWDLMGIGFSEDDYVNAQEKIWYLKINDISNGPYVFEEEKTEDRDGIIYQTIEYKPKMNSLQLFKLSFNELQFKSMFYPVFDGSCEIIVPIRGVDYELQIDDPELNYKIKGKQAINDNIDTNLSTKDVNGEINTRIDNQWAILFATSHYPVGWNTLPASAMACIVGLGFYDFPELDLEWSRAGLIDYGWNLIYCMDGAHDEVFDEPIPEYIAEPLKTCNQTDDSFLETLITSADQICDADDELIIYAAGHGDFVKRSNGPEEYKFYTGTGDFMKYSESEGTGFYELIEDITDDGTHVFLWTQSCYSGFLQGDTWDDHTGYYTGTTWTESEHHNKVAHFGFLPEYQSDPNGWDPTCPYESLKDDRKGWKEDYSSSKKYYMSLLHYFLLFIREGKIIDEYCNFIKSNYDLEWQCEECTYYENHTGKASFMNFGDSYVFRINKGRAWWDNEWQFRRKISLENTETTDLINHQVCIELPLDEYVSKVKNQGDDFRFTNEDSTFEFPYWIEEWDTQGNKIKIWVQVDLIRASTITNIYLYYGNDIADPESDISATCIAYDDFDDYEVNELPKSSRGWESDGSYALPHAVVNTQHGGMMMYFDNPSGIRTALLNRWADSGPVSIHFELFRESGYEYFLGRDESNVLPYTRLYYSQNLEYYDPPYKNYNSPINISLGSWVELEYNVWDVDHSVSCDGIEHITDGSGNYQSYIDGIDSFWFYTYNTGSYHRYYIDSFYVKKISTVQPTVTIHKEDNGIATTWWDNNWDYRREILISQTDNYYVFNYQVKIELDAAEFEGKTLTNGEDIRFIADNNLEELDYWIEYWGEPGEISTIWVKLPCLTKNYSIIYMYYGNFLALAKSNPDTTFVYFEDFEDYQVGYSPNENGWFTSSQLIQVEFDTISNSKVLALNKDGSGLPDYAILTWDNLHTDYVFEYDYYTFDDTGLCGYHSLFVEDYYLNPGTIFEQTIVKYDDGSIKYKHYYLSGYQYDDFNPILDFSNSVWYTFEEKVYSSNYYIYEDGIEYKGSPIDQNNMDFSLCKSVWTTTEEPRSLTYYIDNIRVRKMLPNKGTYVTTDVRGEEEKPIINTFSDFILFVDSIYVSSSKTDTTVTFSYDGGGPYNSYVEDKYLVTFSDCIGDFYVEVIFDSSAEMYDIWYIYLDVGYYDEGISSYYRKAKIRTIDHWAYNWGYYQTYGPTSNHQHGTQGVVGATETGNKLIIKRENGILICEIIDSNSGVHYIQNYGVFSDTINAISLDFMSHTLYYSGTSSAQFYNLYAYFEI